MGTGLEKKEKRRSRRRRRRRTTTTTTTATQTTRLKNYSENLPETELSIGLSLRGGRVNYGELNREYL